MNIIKEQMESCSLRDDVGIAIIMIKQLIYLCYNISDYSMNFEKNLSLEKSEVSLNSIVTDLYPIFEPLANRKGLSFSIVVKNCSNLMIFTD